jgi:hypothetical protein
MHPCPIPEERGTDPVSQMLCFSDLKTTGQWIESKTSTIITAAVHQLFLC